MTTATPHALRRLRHALKGLALIAAFGWATAAGAATITVTTLDDERNNDGDCSLREAVAAANTDTAVDACAAGETGEDDIVFGAVLIGSTISLGQEAIAVTDSVRIDGSLTLGSVTLDGGGLYRIFDVAQGAALALSTLTLTNGTAPSGGAVIVREDGSLEADGVTFSDNDATGNDADQGGGAVYFLQSSGTIRDSEFTGNTASGTSGSGGALFVNGATGTVAIGGSTFSGNASNRAGGAIENRDGDLQISGTDFAMNDAGTSPGNGGAIHLTGEGTATVVAGTVSENTAVEGGGFWNNTATMTVDGVTFTDNDATGDGTADRIQGGGALFNNGGRLEVMDATITGNAASGTSGSGGGILNGAGTTIVMTSEIANNTANRAGGGLEDTGGTVILVMSEFDRNSVADDANPGNGGGVHSGGGLVVVAGGVYARNRAVEGGGLWTSGTLVVTSDEADIPDDMMPDVVMPTITVARIAGNEATGDDADQGGGGLYATPAGSILLVDADVLNNTASGASGSGGGIFSAGDLTVIDGRISGNAANRAGGGIEDAAGTVTLTDVTLDGNSIDTPAPGNGGGLHSGGGDVTIVRGRVTGNTAAEGGGLWSNGTLTINGGADGDMDADDDVEDGDRSGFTVISGNEAEGADAGTGGGGVYVETGGTASIRYATLDGNAASGVAGSGGGVFVADGASASLAYVEVTNNTANRAGGGIEIDDDVLTGAATSISIRQATIDGNAIDTPMPGNGGGLHAGGGASVEASMVTVSNNSAREGGGLWINVSASLELGNATVAGNEATEDGGGVYDNDGGTFSLSSVTVAGNAAGGDGGGLFSAGTDSFAIQNTIVGDNTAGGSGPDCFGSFESGGFNLVEDNTACAISGDVGTNILGADPGLQPLADNGGFTMTRAITASSRAVDAGDSAFDVDQRGLDRQFTQDDIGAFELGASPVATGDELAPGAFGLEAPRPNPTTGRTAVRFTVRDAEPVELAVFNVLGQKVLTAFDGPASPSETQSVEIDVSGLAAGVYVIRLQGAEGVATRQVTVVR